MLFEIYRMDGARVEWSESEKCLPNKETFLRRTKDGYTIKLNGKVVKTYEKMQEHLAQKK